MSQRTSALSHPPPLSPTSSPRQPPPLIRRKRIQRLLNKCGRACCEAEMPPFSQLKRPPFGESNRHITGPKQSLLVGATPCFCCCFPQLISSETRPRDAASQFPPCCVQVRSGNGRHLGQTGAPRLLRGNRCPTFTVGRNLMSRWTNKSSKYSVHDRLRSFQ